MNTYEFFIENDFTEIIKELNDLNLSCCNDIFRTTLPKLFPHLEHDSRIEDVEIVNPGTGNYARISLKIKEDSFLFWFYLDLVWVDGKFRKKCWTLRNNITLFFQEHSYLGTVHLTSEDFIGLISREQKNFKSIITSFISIYHGISFWSHIWFDWYNNGQIESAYKKLFPGTVFSPIIHGRIKLQIKALFLIDYYNFTPITSEELWVITDVSESYFLYNDTRYQTIEYLFYTSLDIIKNKEDFESALKSILEEKLIKAERGKVIYNAREEFYYKTLGLIREISEKYELDPKEIATELINHCGIDKIDKIIEDL